MFLCTARREGSVRRDIRVRVADMNGRRPNARHGAKQDKRSGSRGTKEKMLLSTFLTHDNTSQNGIPPT